MCRQSGAAFAVSSWSVSLQRCPDRFFLLRERVEHEDRVPSMRFCTKRESYYEN